MKEDIIKAISRYGDIALTGLKRRVKDSSGELVWYLQNTDGEARNVFVATDVNEDFIRSVNELMNEGAIEVTSCHPMIVSFDGGEIYDYKIAKPGKVYKKLRWLPLVLNLTDSKKEEIFIKKQIEWGQKI